MFRKKCSLENYTAQVGKTVNYETNISDKSASDIIDEMENIFFSDLTSDVDADLLDKYLDRLDELAPISEEYNVNEMYESFRNNHAILIRNLSEEKEPEGRSRLIAFRKVLIIAATICMLLFVGTIAYANNSDSKVASWIQEVLSFGSPYDKEYGSLREALDDHGLNEVALPSWLPSNYVLSEINVENTSTFISFFAQYTDINNGNDLLLVTVTQGNSATYTDYEKDDGSFQTLTFNNQHYYVISNNGRTSIVWNVDNCDCSISGNMSDEDVSMIIESMK